jgi:hypothetical protein
VTFSPVCSDRQVPQASVLKGILPLEINTELPFCSNSYSPLEDFLPLDSYQDPLFADLPSGVEEGCIAVTRTSQSVVKITLSSSSITCACKGTLPPLPVSASPRRSPVLSPSTLSSQLHSAAMGAGLVKKLNKMRKKHFPCMNNYDIAMPGSNAAVLPVFLNHIEINPASGLYQNPIVTVVPGDQVKLDLAVGPDDRITLSMKVTEGLSNKLVGASGTTELPPSGPFALKCGRVRRRYRVPFFTSRADWSLKPAYFEEVMDTAMHYDASNGHVFPGPEDWVDAFSDPRGSNKHFQRFWSPLDNAFQHEWHKHNIFAFPPMNDDLLLKTLQYHSVQQNIAAKQGKGFRGIYLVPYQPRSPFWKFTGNFQLLKYYRAGTPMFEAVSKHGGGKHSVSAPVPMCVLYDMGYQLPNIHLAFLHAMDLCTMALASTLAYDMEGGDWEHVPWPTNEPILEIDKCSWNLGNGPGVAWVEEVPSLSSRLDDGGGAETSDPTHNPESQTEELEGIEDMTQPSKLFGPFPYVASKETRDQKPKDPFPADRASNESPNSSSFEPVLDIPSNIIYPEAVNRIRLYNMTYCQDPPVALPEQDCRVQDSSVEEALARLESAGKLTEMLEDDFPEWEEVDQAVKEHVKLLQRLEKLPQKPEAEEGDQPSADNADIDPQAFDKPWTQGGLLPRGSLRTVSKDGKVTVMDKCIVIKNKVLNKYNTTSLVDGGASDSVLNVDWYTARGIDWKSVFQIQPGSGKILMADHSSIPCIGTTTLKIELSDCPGKYFTQKFELVHLGPHSYAQILGIDWSNTNWVENAQPEYSLKFRLLGCTLIARPMPMQLYQFRVNNLTKTGDSPCEEISPTQLAKDIKLMSARLRRLHVYRPPSSFIRQVIVRPASEEEIIQTQDPAPSLWQKDDALEERAAALRARIALELRQQYKDVLDGEPHGLNDAMPHKHVIEVQPGTNLSPENLKDSAP